VSFLKKIWTDRVSAHPNRRILTNEDSTTNVVTVARYEGIISQQGDAFSATNMNDLEDRIENGMEELSVDLDEINNNLSNVESTTHSVTINNVNFGTLVEKRVGKVVTITFSGGGSFTNTTVSTTYTICTLTNKALIDTFFLGTINAGIGNQSYAFMSVTATGKVTFVSPDTLSSTRTLKFSCTYLCE
jgi:hypothetical protein